MTDLIALLPDGRRLRYERHGDGRPVVVLEAGMGVSGAMWGAVIPLVAARTTVVAYDRAGFGTSTPDDRPRTLARLAADLDALLDALDTGPCVLVGHSWGGPIVRTLAAARPGRVAGLVLVDQTDEGCDLYFSRTMSLQDRLTSVTIGLLARTGVLRREVARQAAQLPEPWASAARAHDGTPTAVAAQRAEAAASPSELRRLRDQPLATPDVPLTVISGGEVGRFESRRRGPLVEAHRRRAAATPSGRHVVAERSSHLVPLTEPEVVAAEVLRIVDQVRTPPAG